MSIFGDFFSWYRTRNVRDDKTKVGPRRPQDVDYSEPMVVNKALTQGLYHNTYPGLKLAGAMAFTPIALPIWFMGVPIPQAEDETTQEMLNAIVEQMYRRMNQIHLQCHREGTIWIFPKFDARRMTLVWEFISDDCVSDIIRDLNNLEPIKIITDENIILQVGENQTANVHRKRIYTRERVEVKYLAGKDSVPAEVKDKTYRNVLGILPIAFSNNADGDEIRGHSDYERVITDLKNYHDIDLKRSTFLAKFEPKLWIKVKNTVKEWLANNGESDTSLSSLEVYRRDIIFAVEGEDAKYIFPDQSHEAYQQALATTFWKIVEGSGVPEMLWNKKIEGNHASAQEQMNNVVKFVEDKRDQKNDSYRRLFEASLALMLASTMDEASPRVKAIEWNTLDALSDEVKAKIMRDFAQAASFFVDKASATKEMLFELWNRLFPGVAPETFNLFKEGLADMAKHRQFVNTDYAIAADMTGDPNADLGEPIPADDTSGI